MRKNNSKYHGFSFIKSVVVYDNGVSIDGDELNGTSVVDFPDTVNGTSVSVLDEGMLFFAIRHGMASDATVFARKLNVARKDSMSEVIRQTFSG